MVPMNSKLFICILYIYTCIQSPCEVRIKSKLSYLRSCRVGGNTICKCARSVCVLGVLIHTYVYVCVYVCTIFIRIEARVFISYK